MHAPRAAGYRMSRTHRRESALRRAAPAAPARRAIPCDAGIPTPGLATQPDRAMTVLYPVTMAIPHSDNYHGKTVEDPFRWLEDVDSTETKDWVSRQNAVTFEYLSGVWSCQCRE